MKSKIIGILTLIACSLSILLIILIQLEGEFFNAWNLQLLIVTFVSSVTFAGLYLTKKLPKQTLTRIGLPFLGLVLILASVAVAFNIFPFLNGYHWLISLGLLYLLVVELQLLNWSNKPGLIPQICSFVLILTHSFLILFFITKWSYSGLGMIIDLCVILSIVAFIIGLLTVRKEIISVEPKNVD